MYNLVSQQRGATMTSQHIISVQCKNCKIMELDASECAILVMPNGEHFFVFNCPDCRDNSQAHKLNKLQAAYWCSKGIKLFYAPSKCDFKSEDKEEYYIDFYCRLCKTIRTDPRRCYITENALGQTCVCTTCPNCNTEIQEPIDGARKKEYMQFLINIGVQEHKNGTVLGLRPISEEEIGEFAARLADESIDIIKELNR